MLNIEASWADPSNFLLKLLGLTREETEEKESAQKTFHGLTKETIQF